MSNISNFVGVEIEKKTAKAFESQGWEYTLASYPIEVTDKKPFYPDIVLSKNGRIYGYIECYGNHIGEKKREEILYIFEQCKPELFILTNGKSYEVYFEGKYIGTMTIPLGFEEYSRMKRLIEYSEMIKDKLNGKESN